METFRIKENELRSIQLVEVVSKNTGLNEDESAEVVAYNIITVYQLAAITCRSTSAIQNLMRPLRDGETPKLKSVLPFQYKGGKKGPVFILFDQACYDYIISTKKPNAINHEKSQRISEK